MDASKQHEEASANARKFLAELNHELRTPLNAILGFAQMMGHSAQLSQRQRQELDIIEANGWKLLSVIEGKLTAVRPEADAMARVIVERERELSHV